MDAQYFLGLSIFCSLFVGSYSNKACMPLNGTLSEKEEVDGQCYFVSTTIANWWDAQDKCKDLLKGSHLVSIESEEVLKFLYDEDVCTDGIKYWIGLYRTTWYVSENWIWETNRWLEPSWKDFKNKDEESNGNKYAFMQNQHWVMSDGERPTYFICEKKCMCDKIQTFMEKYLFAIAIGAAVLFILLCFLPLLIFLLHWHKKKKKSKKSKSDEPIIPSQDETLVAGFASVTPSYAKDLKSIEYYSHTDPVYVKKVGKNYDNPNFDSNSKLNADDDDDNCLYAKI